MFGIWLWMDGSCVPSVLFLLKHIQHSFLCLSSLLIIKVSSGSIQANRYPIWNSLGLCSLSACPHEGVESVWEGQHVFSDVENDQPKQRVGEQCSGVPSRHSKGTLHFINSLPVVVNMVMAELTFISFSFIEIMTLNFQLNQLYFYCFKEGLRAAQCSPRENSRSPVMSHQ